MPSFRAAKGKKRAYYESTSEGEGSDTPVASTSQVQIVQPVKKPKRAVTRKCPVCDEDIPVRLLAKHSELESQRVEEIMQCIGSPEVLDEAEPDDGFTARTRRSALKARKNISLSEGRTSTSKSNDRSSSGDTSLDVLDKALRTIKRHRKQRHAKLREMAKDDEDASGLSGYRNGRGRWAGRGNSEETLCPVCLKMVQGDSDVVEAHVDACLAHQARLQDEREMEERERSARTSRERDPWEEVEIDGEVRIRVTDGATFRGTGFDIRDRNQQDVDDDIDVDGEDDILYGAAQFNEGDILTISQNTSFLQPHSPDGDSGLQIDDSSDEEADPSVSGEHGDVGRGRQKTLQDLVAAGKLVKRRVESMDTGTAEVKKVMDEIMGVGEAERVNGVVEQARTKGDPIALIEALEDKVKLLESIRVCSSTSLLCRICLDPYDEPTVSTGCWHTCCRECWLRCLGSTKLCPICKRITSAADLRRVYL